MLKCKNTCRDFGNAAGGWVGIVVIPVAIFVSTVVLLYVTAPSFVRKKCRDELELPGVDHSKVFALAGVFAGVALMGIVTLVLLKMRNKATTITVI